MNICIKIERTEDVPSRFGTGTNRQESWLTVCQLKKKLQEGWRWGGNDTELRQIETCCGIARENAANTGIICGEHGERKFNTLVLNTNWEKRSLNFCWAFIQNI